MGIFFAFFALSYTYHVLGISIGYHRGLSHRSFKLPKLVEYFFVLGAYFCFEGAPIFWAGSHRLHHRYSDMPGDPHSPKDGLWHSILGWMSKPVVIITDEQYKTICPDLFRDPFYRFLHAGGKGRDGWVCLVINVISRVILLAVFGPVALAGNLLGSVCAFIAPLMVNSICHIPALGYQNFPTPDLSQNVWFVGLAAFGEGWHNNHHAFPQSARHGLKPSEFDFSFLVLTLLAKVGLARDIRLPKASAINLAAMGQQSPDSTRQNVATFNAEAAEEAVAEVDAEEAAEVANEDSQKAALAGKTDSAKSSDKEVVLSGKR
jgi:fatty-acid desaturase